MIDKSMINSLVSAVEGSESAGETTVYKDSFEEVYDKFLQNPDMFKEETDLVKSDGSVILRTVVAIKEITDEITGNKLKILVHPIKNSDGVIDLQGYERIY